MSYRNCIVEVVDQWAQAVRDHDLEHYLCKMVNGKKVFTEDDQCVQDFFDDREGYWKKNGWHLVDRDGRKTLTPTQCLPSVNTSDPPTPATSSKDSA